MPAPLDEILGSQTATLDPLDEILSAPTKPLPSIPNLPSEIEGRRRAAAFKKSVEENIPLNVADAAIPVDDYLPAIIQDTGPAFHSAWYSLKSPGTGGWSAAWHSGWENAEPEERTSTAQKVLSYESEGLLRLPTETEARQATDDELRMLQEAPGLEEGDRLRVERISRAKSSEISEIIRGTTFVASGLLNPFGLGDRLIPGLAEYARQYPATIPEAWGVPLQKSYREMASNLPAMVIIGTLFKAVAKLSPLAWQALEKIPGLGKAIPTIEKALTFSKLAETSPVTAKLAATVIKQAAMAQPVAAAITALSAVGEDMTWDQAVHRYGENAISFAAISVLYGMAPFAYKDVRQAVRLETWGKMLYEGTQEYKAGRGDIEKLVDLTNRCVAEWGKTATDAAKSDMGIFTKIRDNRLAAARALAKERGISVTEAWRTMWEPAATVVPPKELPAGKPAAAAPTPGSRTDLVAQVQAMSDAGEPLTPETVSAKLAVGRDVAVTLIGEVQPSAPAAAPGVAPAPAGAESEIARPTVGAEAKVAPPTKPEAPLEVVEAEITPVREPLAPTEAKRGPMVRAMPTAERQQLAERLELAASEAAGQDLDVKELRTRFTQAVQEVVPKAQQGAALALTEQITGERSFLRALSKVEKQVVKTYGVGEEKMVSEPEALRGRLRGERVAAQAAWKAASDLAREKAKVLKVATKEEARVAKTAIKEIRAELVDAIRETLPVSERGRLITQIRDAETPKNLAKALDRVDKVVEQYGQRRAQGRLVKLLKKAKRAKLRKQYKPVVEKILAGYNITKPSDSTLGKLADLAHYLSQHPDDHFLTPREIAALEKITARNVRDMTAEELDAVSDAITQILHANRTTNRILAGQQRGRISESAEQLRKAMKQPFKGYGPHEMTPAESRGVFRRIVDWVKRIITPPRYRATLADQQSRDPGQKGGPLAEILERPIAWGASDVLAYEQGAEDVLFAAMRAEGMDPHSQEIVRQLQEVPVAIILASGDTLELSIDELMSFYANTGDAENRRALVRDGWNPEYVFHRKTPGGKPTLVRAVRVQPLPLTAEDVLAIRALLPESYRRIVDAAQAHKNGPLVEAAWDAIQTVKGYAPETLPGHWHLRRNRAAQVRDAGELQRLWYDAALEDSGITKDRSPGANQPVITGHFTEELTRQTGILSRIAGLAVQVRDARMFLGNPLVRETLDSNLGPDYAREWETLLRNVADVAPAEVGPITQLVKKQTGRFMAAKLSLNIISGAKTVGSIAPAAHYVGWSYMFNALLDGPSAIGEALARARIYSPSIRDRYERSMRDLQSPGYTQGVARLGPTPWVEQGMIFIRSGDQTVVGTVWLGAEKRIDAENPGLRESDPAAYWELVRRFAEDVVNWTQPFAGTAIQPPIGVEAKKNPWIHWTFTMFKSQAIQNTTMALDATDRFARSPKGKEDYKRLLSAYVSLAIGAAWYFAWTQFARQLYKPLRVKLLGEERAEKEDKISTIFNALRATVGNVVFIDPALDAAESISRELSGLSGIGGAETPLAQIVENMNRSIVEIGKAVEDGYDGEWQKSKDHVVKGTLRSARVLADVTGMPDVVPRYLDLLYNYAAVEEEAGPPKPPKPPEPQKPPK